ncbi:Aconitate hydratase 2 (EC 4.2.1.3) [uncultured Gammaproteobacteria bacterium]|jgi:aconitate hydratase 2/2-methylisocitrate dehydratase|uniref:Aconitate hydratase 2 (EC) n=3 Tax=sulfur-oxidizing symbionts TaxID=32036 RepID=A0ACA8ZSF2_9GAMM|nr:MULTISPECIES: bifunctional aconitate hydratase 2/2-methylisocitrate dehydratase [sulfur-oxidizing symbionts]CAC5845345.1 Aconitate hydratase 2 (EC 4.2.1.3) [uncultured Gammaproteobacteria bacterium]CAB5506502.1 Aconitate hydratase 2 (EC [Bathymodiolus azoricus thioautotrophic gill symbiont]CAB5508223.1 Aconitate hydratase 2 (EC [Bathymodiolus thermophilus thioautotrophic gill symbiont]CAC9427388.1 Aconitate hydratase 2 (EC 4.2.1.3) [uncultured Gammaproteobacteria bacterium]CAC9508960.1 Acon
MKTAYLTHINERAKDNLPPLALTAQQTKSVVESLINGNDDDFYLDLLTHCIPPGVDEAAYVKAGFLASVAKDEQTCNAISQEQATFLLGTMMGGYNIAPLIELLDIDTTAQIACDALSKTLLIYEAHQEIVEKSTNNTFAKQVVDSWANADWFTSKNELSKEIKLTVFRVDGEINTDDLSPATQAWSRPDIPLHAQSMLVKKMDNPLETIAQLKEKGLPLTFVGDVVGTGSSRKSAINSVLWHMGDNIDYVPNKHNGGVILGGNIAPIFFNTAQDSGALPIECDVSKMQMGDEITLYPYEGKIVNTNGETISTFKLTPNTIPDEVRAGGRIPLIIGRGLTDKTRFDLDLSVSDIFLRPEDVTSSDAGYTLAQKIVGKACGVEGVRPDTYCEPRMTTVGSQDTTGAMTRDELKELACLGFSADLVMQSFCHTAAYPKPVDLELQHSLPDFMRSRGGVTLKPGDGIIHSWLNRMLLPDTVGTGGDSHTRFPIGISFPAGSGLVAFGASIGVLPLDMPESVLVRFSGTMQKGITLRDLVNAIPYVAIQQGLLTVEKTNKKNIFSGRILEIEGLGDLKIEQAFELTDASAERSSNGCTIKLNKAPVAEYLQSNIALLSSMIEMDYEDKKTIARRIQAMQKWLDAPELLAADDNAEYAAIIEINLDDIKEPILACPNDPDDVKLLSEIANTKIDEVFIGSCMTNIGHFRAAAQLLKDQSELPTELWVAPPTRMDEAQLKKEGIYQTFESITQHTETPGCSLCMGNQARVKDNATVVSTSTRNFPNRLGDDADVYLSSAEVAAIAAKLGRIPTVEEYLSAMQAIESTSDDIYQYLNFDQISQYQKSVRHIALDTIL